MQHGTCKDTKQGLMHMQSQAQAFPFIARPRPPPASTQSPWWSCRWPVCAGCARPCGWAGRTRAAPAPRSCLRSSSGTWPPTVHHNEFKSSKVDTMRSVMTVSCMRRALQVSSSGFPRARSRFPISPDTPNRPAAGTWSPAPLQSTCTAGLHKDMLMQAQAWVHSCCPLQSSPDAGAMGRLSRHWSHG